ncbi:MAG TPA: hypothetical protein VLK84_30115 [Longimicrobium sp.]|nr:hypothetical protein [Longimicrobium sp.]
MSPPVRTAHPPPPSAALPAPAAIPVPALVGAELDEHELEQVVGGLERVYLPGLVIAG